jgi:hypothetical protein
MDEQPLNPAWETASEESIVAFHERWKRFNPATPEDSIAPAQWVLVDLDPLWAEPEGVPADVSEEIERLALRAFRLCTRPDESIFVWDEISGHHYRFWPHREATSGPERWPAGFFPDGDDQVWVSQDFEWGIHAVFVPLDSSWHLLVFGKRLLDALTGYWPTGWSAIIRRSSHSRDHA